MPYRLFTDVVPSPLRPGKPAAAPVKREASTSNAAEALIKELGIQVDFGELRGEVTRLIETHTKNSFA